MRALVLLLALACELALALGPVHKLDKHPTRNPANPDLPESAQVEITGADLQIAALWDDAPTTVKSDQEVFYLTSWHAASYDRAVILKVVNWPAALNGKTITGATLELFRWQGYTAEAPSVPVMTARQVLQPVVMAEVTWSSYSTNNAWGTAGAKGAADVNLDANVGTVSVPNNLVGVEPPTRNYATQTIGTGANLVALLQGWKDGSITNNGMFIYPSSFADYHTFYGPTGATPPVLTITYTP